MPLETFLLGAIAMAYFVAATFFLRFWFSTNDRLFILFAVAFILVGVTRIGVAVSTEPAEMNATWYWMRLTGFIVILMAIVDKNRE